MPGQRRDFLFPPLSASLTVFARVKILGLRHRNSYYVNMRPSLIPKESRPTQMVTTELIKLHVNKRSKNLNKKYCYFLFEVRDQNVRRMFETEMLAATTMKEAVDLVERYHRSYGNYAESKKTKFPASSGEPLKADSILLKLMSVEPLLQQLLNQPPLTILNDIKDEIKETRGPQYVIPTSEEAARVVVITHFLFEHLTINM